MDWRHDYVEGNTRATCSICGCPRRFPDDMTFCSDKLFRCERCMETPALETDRVLAAFRAQPEEIVKPLVVAASYERTPTLLEIATGRVETLFPSWTPTDTFSDTYEVLPGAVGSDWSLTDFGAGTVTAPSDGVVRVTVPTNTSIEFARNGFSRTSPTANRWYGISRFAVQSTPDIRTIMMFGWVASTIVFTGVIGSLSSTFFTVGCEGGTRVVSDVEIDPGSIHTGEVWSLGDGYLRASIDRHPTISVPMPASLGTIVPIHYSNVASGVGGGTSIVDVYDSVFFK